MTETLDVTGQKFGKLTVLGFSHRDSHSRKYWICKCDCGNISITREESLKSGHTRTCGKNYFYEKDGYMIGINHDGAEFIFSIEDYEAIKQHTWGLRSGYMTATINKKNVKLHRFILGLKKNEVADHINNNTMNNRRENLRKCNNQQNHFNRSKTRGTSKYKGVHKPRRGRNWAASIGYNGKTIYLGQFKDELCAAKAYNAAALKYFGDFAWLNELQVAQ